MVKLYIFVFIQVSKTLDSVQAAVFAEVTKNIQIWFLSSSQAT